VGDFVFALVVICANLKVLFNSHIVNWGLILMVFGSILSYVLCQVAVSEAVMFKASDQFGSMKHVISKPATWIALLFWTLIFALFDYGVEYLFKFLKMRKLARDEKAEL